MKLFSALLGAAALCSVPVLAYPQAALLQGGPWAQGHLPMYVGPGGNFGQPILMDGGGSGGGALGVNPAEIGIVSRSPTNTYPSVNSGNGPDAEHFCMYDAPTNNASGYHYLCMDPNAQGGGVLAYGAGGMASQLPFSILVNGAVYSPSLVQNVSIGTTRITGALSTPATFNTPLAGLVYNSSFNASGPSSSGALIPTLFDVEGVCCGPIVNDGFNALGALLNITHASSPSSTYRFYAAANFFGNAAANDNGVLGVPQGFIYGLGAVGRLQAGATYWKSVTGAEFNVAVDSGATAPQYKSMLNLYEWPEDAVAGTVVDAALSVSAGGGAIGLTNGIQIDDADGQFPVAAAGTLIKAFNGTVATGIDFNQMTMITGDVLQWHNSDFSLSWLGRALLSTANFASGGTSPVAIGKWSGGNYGAVSFDNSFVDGSMTGIFGGNTSDDALYLESVHGIIVRPNGATTNSFVFTSTGLTVNLSGSWTAVTNCGSLASSTKCFSIVDPNGNTVYVPVYGTF